MVVPMPGHAVTAPRAILFGKLPRHGDFVARGLSSAARTAWDVWLTDVLDEGRTRLGDRFSSAHDAAPPWRFVGGPGDLGVNWRAGALAPSIDSVGRRFFLVAAADDLSPSQAQTYGDELSCAMEALIYQVFEHGWDADVLSREAGHLVSVVLDRGDGDPARKPRERWWTTLGAPGSLDQDSLVTVFDNPPADLIGAAIAMACEKDMR